MGLKGKTDEELKVYAHNNLGCGDEPEYGRIMEEIVQEFIRRLEPQPVAGKIGELLDGLDELVKRADPDSPEVVAHLDYTAKLRTAVTALQAQVDAARGVIKQMQLELQGYDRPAAAGPSPGLKMASAWLKKQEGESDETDR